MPFSTSNKIGVDLEAVFTPPSSGDAYVVTDQPPHEVGTVVDGTDGSSFVYVQYGTGGATGAGYVVVLDPAYTDAIMVVEDATGAFGDPVGVAMAEAAENDYGWVQRKGVATVRAAANTAANATLNATATAGQLDDAGTADTFDIDGMVLTTATSGSAATVAAYLNWPTIGATNTV